MENGVPAHLFDHIDDLLDFPCDGDGDDVLWLAQEPLLLLPPLPVPVVDGNLDGGEDEKKAEAGFGMEEDKFVPCDELDIEQLEWMSKFIEDSDSFSLCLPAAGGVGAGKSVGERCRFRTSSPVSVLEANTNGGGGIGVSSSDSYTTASSSSSSSTSASHSIGCKEGRAKPPPPMLSPPGQPEVPVVPGRTRSKRARPATFSPHPLVVITCLSPRAAAAATSDPESIGDSSPPSPTPSLKKKNKKKNPYADETESPPPPPPPSPPPAAAAGRKCAHCQIQKTPQWRAGPMGPKTLCNACGVRYKSGRLFPEYRPAASPTFVPTAHSNSHKKVVEMRIQATQTAGADGCDLLDCIRRQRD